MASPSNDDLTTAQLADRTGLSAGTLRMWESRHAFPEPTRLPGGHRRYRAQDVALVREVVRLRDDGLSLPAAIERARHRRPPPAASIFAGLRRRRPEVAPAILPKRVVLALTRAIEDEYCARGAQGLLVGSFQQERFYRGSRRRWRELARTADLAVVLADFESAADPTANPVEVAIDRRHPLAREWAVVIAAEGAQACLAAWEQPTHSELPDGARRFEVLWSFDPAVVTDAIEVAIELLRPLHPGVAQRVVEVLDAPAISPGPGLEYGGALAQRMIGYLGRLLEAPVGAPGGEAP